MIYNHLSLINFLLYLELLFVLIILFQSFIVPLPTILITSIFNVISYKTDTFILYLNIPFTIIEIISLKILIADNTSNFPFLFKSLFYIGGAVILTINHLIHRKDVYKLAIKENNFLLKYTAWKFFKLFNWLYPLTFLVAMFVSFDLTNPLSSWLFSVLTWLSHLKYIGGLLPTISFMLLLGTFSYAIFFLFGFRKLKRDFEAGFYNDALNG